MSKSHGLLVVCLLGICAEFAFAYDFIPTDAEFLGWPAHCKVVYSRTNSSVANRLGRMINVEEDRVGTTALGLGPYGGAGGIHHHCAGTIWLRRAQLESDARLRRFQLSQAANETLFSMERIEDDHALYAEVFTQMARVRYEQERFQDALQILDDALLVNPEVSTLHTAKGVILYRLGKLQRAKQALEQGNLRVAGKSAEIHYNLGLVLLKLDEPETALEHGKQAYALGYPLPGLRNKLKRAGVWQ